MLRFPLHKKVFLITVAGLIRCEIVKATENFLFCKNVKFQDCDVGNTYIDRNHVVAFSEDFSSNNKENPNSLKNFQNIKSIGSRKKVIPFNKAFNSQ